MEQKELSSTTPHSVFDTPHSGLRAGTPSNQEMPHQVRHEDKTVRHEDLNPESAEGLNLETSQTSQTPQTLTASDLPPAIRAFWDSAPAPFKVPAILTAIDCYCALATRLRFKYTYDLDPHALLLQVLVVAEVCE